MRWKRFLLVALFACMFAFSGCAKKAEPKKFDPQPVRDRADKSVQEAHDEGERHD